MGCVNPYLRINIMDNGQALCKTCENDPLTDKDISQSLIIFSLILSFVLFLFLDLFLVFLVFLDLFFPVKVSHKLFGFGVINSS